MTNKELLFRSSQTAESSGKIIEKLLRNTSLAYLAFSFNIEKETLKYCSSDVFELVPFILELI